MLSLLKRAISPPIPLRTAMQNWQRIAHRLSESPRQRRRQLDSLREVLESCRPLS